MRELKEIGECPKCGCSIIMFKTNQYKRFAKCEECGYSYPLPKRGTISNTGELCELSKVPLMVIENAKNSRNKNGSYFWAHQPCFNCMNLDKCEIIKELEEEFKEFEEFGFAKT